MATARGDDSLSEALQDPPGVPAAAAGSPVWRPDGPARFLNRELSWLDFSSRVVALAEDPAIPLLERTRFLALASRNLDEFFSVRVAALREQLGSDIAAPSPDGLTPADQLAAIRLRMLRLDERIARCFHDLLLPALDAAGIRYSDFDALDDDDRTWLDAVFHTRILPVLTPLAVDPAHPFPYISSLSLNLGVLVGDPAGGEPRIARVKVPPLLPRFVVMPDGERFVPVEQVIAAHLPRLFPGMEVLSHHAFRLTRAADYEVELEEADDLLEAVEQALQRRRRSPVVVRVEIAEGTSDDLRALLEDELEVRADDVYVIRTPIDLGGLADLSSLDRPDLKYPAARAFTPARLTPTAGGGEANVFAAIAEGDILVHHPYDSFATTVAEFIEQASRDPGVLALKQTLYRTGASPQSPIIRSLVRAAEAGKQVVALIELTARWDEQANIQWARVLEEAGVHVVYGTVGMKTHAKLTLVVRDENGRLRPYCHVATGNYNPDTARAYEDIGLFSADPELCADVSELFNALTGYSRIHEYRRLLVAPATLRRGLLRLIAGQAHQRGRITMKTNSLTDPEIVAALYDAAAAGCEIDLVVRGLCCLRPGIPGISETIRVRSLVGRWLEHSRIYRFGSGDSATHWIGSADLMHRNLDRRVEAVTPVLAPNLRAELDEVLSVLLADDVNAWELHGDGGWSRVPRRRGLDAQQRLAEIAQSRARVPSAVTPEG